MAAGARIDTIEAQLERGSRRITEETIDRFGGMLSAKLHENDPQLRSSYMKMFVSDVRVSDREIVVSGPIAALEAGVATGLPRTNVAVPSFDRKWCQKRTRYYEVTI